MGPAGCLHHARYRRGLWPAQESDDSLLLRALAW